MDGAATRGKMHGKKALVTGGTSGIGRAIAILFASEGASVAIGDLVEKSPEDGLSIAENIRKSGGNALFVKTDVSYDNDVKSLVDNTVEKFGGIDVVVNSAGIPMKKKLADTSVEDFDLMYGVTVRGAFLTAKHTMPHLLRSGDGRIINIASNFSFTAQPDMVAYVSSKAAVIGLTKALALEFAGAGINVNAICPGAAKTEMSRPFWGTSHGVEFLLPRIPLRKDGRYLASPGDIARLALFLATDESSMITGESILVDGGWNAQ